MTRKILQRTQRLRAIHHVIQRLPLLRRPLHQHHCQHPLCIVPPTTTTSPNGFWNRPIYGAVPFSLNLNKFKSSLLKCAFLRVSALCNHRVVCNAPIETAMTRVLLQPAIINIVLVLPATTATTRRIVRVNVGSFGAKMPIHYCIPICWTAMFSLFNVKRRNVSWRGIKSMDAVGMRKTNKSRGVRQQQLLLLREEEGARMYVPFTAKTFKCARRSLSLSL